MRLRKYLTLLLIFTLSLSILLAYDWWPTASRAPVALAHAFVIGSDPVDGSTVSSAPAVVRIFFNEAIGPASVAHVFAPDGHLVDAAHSSIYSSDPRELDTPLASPGSLPQGGYTVRWTALSNDDGHTTHGVIGFNVGQSSVGLPGETILGPSTSNILPQLDLFGVLSVAWDWLILLALTFWVGILVMEGLVLAGRQEGTRAYLSPRQGTLPGGQVSTRVPPLLRSTPAPTDMFLHEDGEGVRETGTSRQLPEEQVSTLLTQARKQSLPLQWLTLTALLIGEIITLILRTTLLTQALGGSGINLVALGQLIGETNYGHLWLLRIALIGVALALLWWTTRQQNGSTRTITSTKRSNNRFSRLRRQVAQEHKTDLPIAIDNDKESLAEETSTLADAAPDPALLLAPTRGATTFQGAARDVVAPCLGDRYPLASTLSGGQVSRGVGAWLMLVLAGLILFTIALTSDAAQLAQPHASAVVLDWLYLVAQSMWFGALAYLGYVLLPLLLVVEPHHQAGTFAAMLRRLMPATLGILGVLFVSGLFLGESSLSSAQQLITDPYGRALLIKVVLIALMLILNVYVLFVIRPKLARQAVLLPVVDVELPARRTRQSALEGTAHRLRQTLRLQSWLGAGALLCAALMAFYAPPIVFPANSYAISTSTNPTTPSAAAINAQTQKVSGLTVTLQVLPGRVDYANTVVVTINDSVGNPVTDAQVQLSTNMELMDMGTARATVKGGNPTYIATFDKDAAFSMFGLWDIIVRIQRPDQALVQMVFKVTLT